MSLKVKIVLIVNVAILASFFQSCEGVHNKQLSAGNDIEDGSPIINQRIVGVVDTPQLVRFGPYVSLFESYESPDVTQWFDEQQDEGFLEIDLQQGIYEINRKKRCNLDHLVQEELVRSLQGAKICLTTIYFPDTANCMAIGAADVQIVDEKQSHFLRPTVCSLSEHLCNGGSQELRDLLKSVITSSYLEDSSCLEVAP